MDDINASGAGSTETPEASSFVIPGETRQGWLQHRRAKVIAEIERNRRGDYKVPTWVLATALVVMVAGIAAIVIFG